MPSFRIPPPLRHILPARGADVSVASPGYAGTQPQPPITARDKRLQAFLDVTFDVLYDWNIETGAIAFTDRIDEMLGLPAGGFPRSIEGWLERIHLDDHDATMEALSQSILGDAPFSCEYRLRRGDGSWATVTDQGVLLTNRGGRATNMIGAMRDVTRERAAQAVRREADELRRVLFGLPSPAMQVDERGAYVDADDHALAFFERTREEMLASNVATTSPQTVVAGDRRRRRRARRSGELEVSCDVGGTHQAPAAQHRADAHLRRPRLLPARRGHHRAEGDAGGAGALRAGAAPSGDDPRRAQRGAQGAARAARAGPAGARAAHRLQRRPAHRADAGAPEPLLPPPAGAARDRRPAREPARDRRPVRPAAGRERRVGASR